MSKKAKLFWVDLEMTGLDPVNDRILEVAVIGTNWCFDEIVRYKASVKVDSDIIKERMVGDFWEKNKKVRKSLIDNSVNGKSIDEVEKDLLGLLKKHFDKEVYLAGNSIHQDQKFIEREMPKLSQKLHYRMLDVSSWKIVFGNIFNDELKKPEYHRAENDIEGSIEELRYYLTKVNNEKS